MSLKLIPPREGKTPYWSVRGTYLGRYVDRSTKARKRTAARQILQKWEREIERGEFRVKGELTFADAALSYMQAGGERRFIIKLLQHFGRTPLTQIDQPAIDAAAVKLYPNASPATRNRQVYTPVSAILKRAGATDPMKRPIGADGRKLAGWLWPEQAFAIFEAAADQDLEFAIMLVMLTYCPLRLTELLDMRAAGVRLEESFAFVPDSKNGEPRAIHLPPIAIEWLARHPRGLDRHDQKLFRFHKGGHLYELLKVAAFRASVVLPERQAFHIFSHTYGTWMRRYGGLDDIGLVATGRWKDAKSVHRYAHAVVSEEARQSERLPVPKRA